MLACQCIVQTVILSAGWLEKNTLPSLAETDDLCLRKRNGFLLGVSHVAHGCSFCCKCSFKKSQGFQLKPRDSCQVIKVELEAFYSIKQL